MQAGEGQGVAESQFGGRPVTKGALEIVIIYAVVAAAWILFSDQALEALVVDRATLIRLSVVKGWLFVAVTAALLYVLVRRLQARLIAAQGRERESERERLDSLRLLATIAESSDDAIFAKDAAGRYLLINRAACEFVGKPADAVVGRDDRAIFPPAEAEILMAFGREVMASGAIITREEHLTTAAGARVFLATKGPLRDSDGRVSGVFGISRDITRRKAAEEALQASEARFRALVEQTLAGVYVIQDGLFRYVNPAFAAIFGYPAPDALIDRVPVLGLVSPADRQRVTENIAGRLDRSNPNIQYAFVGQRRDGSPVDVEVHGRVFDYQGRPAVIGLILDITARVAAEAESRRNVEELLRLNRATVGRELDIIEMKRVINDLSRQLGREPPYPLAFLAAEGKTGSGGQR